MEWRHCFPMRGIGRSLMRRGYLSIHPGIPAAAHIPAASDGVSAPELLPQAHPAAMIHLQGVGTQGLLRPYTAWHSPCWLLLHFETHPHAACSTLWKTQAEPPGSDYFLQCPLWPAGSVRRRVVPDTGRRSHDFQTGSAGSRRTYWSSQWQLMIYLSQSLLRSAGWRVSSADGRVAGPAGCRKRARSRP